VDPSTIATEGESLALRETTGEEARKDELEEEEKEMEVESVEEGRLSLVE